MIRSAVTVSLVDEARGGPFVFWDDLPAACRQAAELGFDAVEIFAPSAEALDARLIQPLLASHDLELAAVGTGAGWVRHKLHLVHPDATNRKRAVDFVRSIIDAGAEFGAPAIIGSLQGRWGDGVTADTARGWLTTAIDELAEHASRRGVMLLVEPLNRYETNMLNTLDAGQQFLATLAADNVRLLADLFHMNIEEEVVGAAIARGAPVIGHVHFVDSNRRPAGCGHLDFEPIVKALVNSGYRGYASAEALPYPNSFDAARLTITAFRRYFGEQRS
jgi:sugar phosphate isomerase/epimerase